jgi:hypothetical protein
MPGKVNVFCPTSVSVTEKFTNFPHRLTSLEGKRIGLHWNGKANGDFFLNRLAELLQNKYGGIKIKKYYQTDPDTAHPERKSREILDLMAKDIDLFITAQGD